MASAFTPYAISLAQNQSFHPMNLCLLLKEHDLNLIVTSSIIGTILFGPVVSPATDIKVNKNAGHNSVQPKQ